MDELETAQLRACVVLLGALIGQLIENGTLTGRQLNDSLDHLLAGEALAGLSEQQQAAVQSALRANRAVFQWADAEREALRRAAGEGTTPADPSPKPSGSP